MALTDIQKVRAEVQDNAGPGLYIIDDSTIQYFLDKNNGSVARASLDTARAMLMKLSQQGNETVDILSLSGSKVAQEFRLALELYLKNPLMNPILSTIKGYAGGTSISDIQANNENFDNNIVQSPSANFRVAPSGYFSV